MSCVLLLLGRGTVSLLAMICQSLTYPSWQVYTLDPELPFVAHYSSMDLDVSLFNLMLVLAQQLEVLGFAVLPCVAVMVLIVALILRRHVSP